ncbi:MAG: hypothetical protein GY842_14355, partial [bacterium]|nr:hypothetical protein [bacterium]
MANVRFGDGSEANFDYDERFNLETSRGPSGAVAKAKYDEWDRAVRLIEGGFDGGVLVPVGSGSCPSAWEAVDGGLHTDRAFDAAGHVVLQRQCQDFIDIGGDVSVRWVQNTFVYNDREQLEEVYQTNLASPGALGQVESGEQL